MSNLPRFEARKGGGEFPNYILYRVSDREEGRPKGFPSPMGYFKTYPARSKGNFVLHRLGSVFGKDVYDVAHSKDGADSKLHDMIGEFVKELEQSNPEKYGDLGLVYGD